MGVRFRKSFKLAPGIRANIGLGGGSLSIGKRGTSVNVGRQGVYSNLCLPGTGLSYRQRLDRQNKQARNSNNSLDKRDVTVTSQLDDETGELTFIDHTGQLSHQKLSKLIWEQKNLELTEMLQNHIDKLDDDTSLIAEIYLDSPHPSNVLTFQKLPFNEKLPELPEKPEAPNKPVLRLVILCWYHKIIPFGVRWVLSRNKKRQSLFDRSIEKWQKIQQQLNHEFLSKKSDAEQKIIEWNRLKDVHNSEQTELKSLYEEEVRINSDKMTELLELEIGNVIWPRETLISFEISEDKKSVYLDVDLPEIEDLPQKVAKFSANRKRLLIKNKAKETIQNEYALHVHGILMRASGVVLTTLPGIDNVVVSGFTQRMDSSTGYEKENYIVSAIVKRKNYKKLNFDNLKAVSPIDFIGEHYVRRKLLKSGIMRAIEPFEINKLSKS